MEPMARRKRSSKGSIILEFALGFALLWLVFTGAFQFGYAMYAYNALTTCVTNGARYAARVDFDHPDHAFIDQVKNLVVYGTPTRGTAPLAPGLKPEHVTVTWTADVVGIPQTVTVGITNYTAQALFQSFTFKNKPRLSVKFAGRYVVAVN
jgi:Flp pilus assembly protein TadG